MPLLRSIRALVPNTEAIAALDSSNRIAVLVDPGTEKRCARCRLRPARSYRNETHDGDEELLRSHSHILWER